MQRAGATVMGWAVFENALGQAGQEGQNVSCSVGQPESDAATFVAFGHQTGEHKTANMFAGGFELDLQFLRYVAQAEIRLGGEEFENFDPAVVGETFDNPLQTFRPRPFAPHNTCRGFHNCHFRPGSRPSQDYDDILKNVIMTFPKKISGRRNEGEGFMEKMEWVTGG